MEASDFLRFIVMNSNGFAAQHFETRPQQTMPQSTFKIELVESEDENEQTTDTQNSVPYINENENNVKMAPSNGFTISKSKSNTAEVEENIKYTKKDWNASNNPNVASGPLSSSAKTKPTTTKKTSHSSSVKKLQTTKKESWIRQYVPDEISEMARRLEISENLLDEFYWGCGSLIIFGIIIGIVLVVYVTAHARQDSEKLKRSRNMDLEADSYTSVYDGDVVIIRKR